MADVVQYSMREMLAALKYEKRPKTFLRDTLIQNVKTHPTTKIELDTERWGRRVAAYVSRRSEANDVEKYGYDTKIHVLPYVKERLKLVPEDLELRMPGGTIYESGSPAGRQAQLVGKYFRELDWRLIRLEENQLAEAITSGTCTVVGKDLNYTITYGRNASNVRTLTAGDRWSESTSDIRGDFKTAAQQMRNVAAGTPDLVILGNTAGANYIDDTEIQALLDNRRTEFGNREFSYQSEKEITYLGRHLDAGINCDVVIYHGTYDNTSGTVTPIINDSDAIFIRRGLRSTAHYSMISNFKSNFVGTRFPMQYVPDDGMSMMLQLESGPLMAVHEIDATYALHTQG